MRVVAAIIFSLIAGSLTAETTGLRLGSGERESTSLTVYQGGFAVVREVRKTILPLGVVELDYESVPRTIEPSSVEVTSLTDRDSLTVLSQSYHFDLITRDSLLEHYLGEKVKYVRSILQDGTYEKILREGVLLATNPEVVDFGDEIEISPEGVISLPYIPGGLRREPTLVWRLDNRIRGSQRIETSYLINSIGWDAEYNLYYDEDASKTDLMLWVNLMNRSGGRFERANLSLVAGQVKRAFGGQVGARADVGVQRTMMMEAASSGVPSEPVSDYHVFRIPDPVSLRPMEAVQLHLVSAIGIPVEKRYLLSRPVPLHQLPMPATERFDIQLSFENEARVGLGRALPSGKVRVYNRRDMDEVPLLLGEDMVSGTPVGEKVGLTVGKAFDLVAERTQKSFRRTSERTTEVSYSIELRNRKDEAATLTLHEVFSGDWTITSQTESGKRINSTTQEYVVELKPGATRTFEYTAQIRY